MLFSLFVYVNGVARTLVAMTMEFELDAKEGQSNLYWAGWDEEVLEHVTHRNQPSTTSIFIQNNKPMRTISSLKEQRKQKKHGFQS